MKKIASFCMTPELDANITVWAKLRGLNRSEFIRQAVAFFQEFGKRSDDVREALERFDITAKNIEYSDRLKEMFGEQTKEGDE